MVAANREACFFHSAAWAKVLHETYGHSPLYFGRVNGDRLSALLPVMEVNSPLTGRRGVSLPFTDECGFLTDGSHTVEDAFRDAADFGRERRWKYLECRGISGLPASAQPSLSFYGHVLSVSEREDHIFKRFDSSVRRAIHKAEKEKVQVEVAQSLESMQAYYSLHCKTRRRHGVPPQSFTFFRSIFRHVLAAGMGFVVVARHEGRPIAAAVYFHFGERAIYKFGASDEAFRHLRGNNLVMWEAIKCCSRKRLARLYFGRISLANEGLRRFEQGFGTEEYRINYFRYDFRKESFVTERDRVYGWYNRVFRLMPLPVSRMVGNLMYRHLS